MCDSRQPADGADSYVDPADRCPECRAYDVAVMGHFAICSKYDGGRLHRGIVMELARTPARPEGISVLVVIPEEVPLGGDDTTELLVSGAAMALAATDYPKRKLTGQVLLLEELEPRRFEVVLEVQS